MTRHRHRDPFTGVHRVLIDGSNLAYAASRGPSPLPQTALIGRLRAIIPPAILVEIAFDGPAEPGLRNTRIASGVTVRHAGHRTADDLLLDAAMPGDLVVTNDRELRIALERRGATTERTDWLLARLARGKAVSPSIGNRRPPPRTGRDAPDVDDR
ncbi:MAG TPA: hypothetical protein VH813_11145 [Candidatus Limnocylindrales bacterium]|jgi:rRNA-processing protein FCF1